MTKDTPAMRLEMRSDPRFLAGARKMVQAVAERLGFEESESSRVSLAVDEALCNIIRHGYDNAADKPIWLSLWPARESDGHPRGIRIVIEDEARQVELATIKSRDLEDIRPHGLGVHII
ncbi:MAG: ATP-binding protein, partial [Planctomycetota bacterium]